MRLIDADALMPKLKFIQEAEHQIYGKESWGFASKCITAIDDAPTIEPKRETGEWIEEDDEMRVICSKCGEPNDFVSDFCPSCGADMRRKPDEQTN